MGKCLDIRYIKGQLLAFGLYNGARYAMDAQGDIVQFGLTIELDNATIPLEDYPQFQEWWQQMCSLFDEMIILRRKGGKSFTDTEKMTA